MENEEYIPERESLTATNKCPNCGGSMSYDIESSNLKCENCGTVVDFDKSDSVEHRKLTDDILKNHEDWKDGAVYKCGNCGAKVVLEKNTIANVCSYCGSPHVVVTNELPGIKPDSVIPFKITLDSARQRFMKWIRGKFFAPKKLKNIDNRSESFNPVYSSSWSFGADTASSYNGTLGRRVTTTRYSNGRNISSTTIRYFRVSGTMAQNYRDFFVQSCDNINAKTFNKLKPFNVSLLKVYRQEYLSGIFAEHYSRNIETCFNDFASYIKRDLRNKIISKHNADTVQSLTIQTQYNDKKFNYVLLPVYIANYTYDSKRYNFYVNGENGKIAGKYPVSKWKVFFTVLGGAVLVGAVAAGILFLSK